MDKRGLYGKYEVKRKDGTGVGDTFVIELDKDPQAPDLLQAISEIYSDTRPSLSADLERQAFILRMRTSHPLHENKPLRSASIDASEPGAVTVSTSEDGDVWLTVTGGIEGDGYLHTYMTKERTVRFCTASGGGARTSRVRKALLRLMQTIKADGGKVVS